jgi:hypothetical protein
MIFALFLFVVALIVIATIPMSEFEKMKKMAMMPVTNPPTPITPDMQIMDDTKNKLLAGGCLISIAILVYLLALVFSIQKGCYKTSLFGMLFGLISGVF